jgi:hypothetical protein
MLAQVPVVIKADVIIFYKIVIVPLVILKLSLKKKLSLSF